MVRVRRRVLLISSSGGVLLDIMALHAWWSRHDVVWAAVPAVDTLDRLAGERVHWVPEQRASRPFSLVPAVLSAWQILRSERPDVIVSAGTGVAIGFFLASWLCRIPSIWLSTLNVVDTPGRAERLCARVASAVLVQQPELARAHRRAIVIGELY